MKKAKQYYVKLASTILAILIALFLLMGAGAGNLIRSHVLAKEEGYECTATIDDSFAEDQIVVVMKDGIDNIKNYTVADFPEISLLI